MRDISLFQILWTASLLFIVSMISQKVADSPKTLRERVNIGLACAFLFTFLALGIIPILNLEF